MSPTAGLLSLSLSVQGCFPAHYPIDIKGQGQLSCLDSNHTHFLLVDDGTQGKYGVEIELRTRLEKCISGKKMGHKGSKTTILIWLESPSQIWVIWWSSQHWSILICLTSREPCDHPCGVCGFGRRSRHAKCESPRPLPPLFGSLHLLRAPTCLCSPQTIYNSMLNGTPCVILAGSGRIADVIAQVAELPVSEVTISRIQEQMKRFFGREYESFKSLNIIEWTKKVCEPQTKPNCSPSWWYWSSVC